VEDSLSPGAHPLLLLLLTHTTPFVSTPLVTVLIKKKKPPWDVPGGSVAKTPCSQCRKPRFYPWPGNKITRAKTESLHAATTDPVCHK